MPIPLKITAGDSVSWTDAQTKDNLGNVISSADYTLTYHFRGNSYGVTLNVTAIADGSGWKTTLSTANTTLLGAVATVYWTAKATKSGEAFTIGSGQMEIGKDLSALGDTPFDGRTQSRKDLEAVQAAMRAMISGGAVQEYTIGNRSLKKMTMSDLIKLESKLKADVVKDEKATAIAMGLGNPNNLLVRFK